MKRLDRIREALEQLNPTPPQVDASVFQPHISPRILGELVECFFYIFFPECTNPPSQTTPTYTQADAMMEWVLGHVADTLTAQIYFAFVLHGDTQAVLDTTKFRPLNTSQRTQLNWNGASSKTLTLFSMEGSNHHSSNGNGNAHDQEVDNTSDFLIHKVLAKRTGANKLPNLVQCDIPVADDTKRESVMPASDNNYSGGQNHVFLANCKRKADAIVSKFLTERLAHVRWLLHTDVEAIFKGDVAASSPSEVVLCYPGLRCMVHQRVAHQLHLLGVPQNFTRMLTELAHSRTGIDIHPHTSIGHHFFMDHGTGIVIGATAIIGNYVSVYQGVTLGARSFPTDKKTGEKIRDLPRHPIIEDGVTLYANAVVLGRVTIGERSTIGGNCWVVRDVPPFSSIVQKAAHVLQPHERMFLENFGSGI
ncbi:serine acetyltransferase [Leptomonas pyrrhocoris]|uniref:serine O-acetyltransferase n=1 Tax=Leptomonas pyrrhocoris TaxID=157538 RepID=A0A0M9G4P2_LEPPY|nr:serine acetyltransferase [Leptomonas pyrrhocoris]KPA82360.1 serine acetyltransferase [Leptomonas pyrrhocoris]|eukprot:XP_015660799.1 serine acetyltransferase [Leptomonas pyrrhocoris]